MSNAADTFASLLFRKKVVGKVVDLMIKRCRMVIYCKDIQTLTGRSESYARKIVAAIRKKCNKEKHELISVEELCSYLGLSEKVVLEHLHAKSD